MDSELIDQHGKFVGTRITVYNLLTEFLDPECTEAYICKVYSLTSKQVAAARAFALNHADTVLARHLEIEERNAIGNPPEVNERIERTHKVLMKFKEWRDKRDAEFIALQKESPNSEFPYPTFREWIQSHLGAEP